ncbi:MAG: VIT1/CCC1 transporter family protein [archaeon]
MNSSRKKGFGFGLTSGVITTLGLIVGLHSSTHLKSVVIGGVLIIAIADALSDALGIHVSEESENKHTEKEIWESTIYTFLAKFVFALTFLVPILLFELNTAIIISIIWGLLLIGIFSFYMAKNQKIKPFRVVLEHLIITIIVIIVTHYVGDLVGAMF